MQQTNRSIVWVMWALASFFYAYQYIIRVLPNIMMIDILERFQIDAALFGQYSGLYYIGYAGMHIPLGILLDKYGPKWVLPISIVMTSIGLIPLIYAENWIYPCFGRMLIGMGSSAAILGVFKIIHLTFNEAKFSLMLGFSVMIGLLGAIYGGQPLNYLISSYGSTLVIQGLILIGVLLAIATVIVLPKHEVQPTDEKWWKNIFSVLSKPHVLGICIFAGLMVGPLEGFADVWGKEYLKAVYLLNEMQAASLPSMIFLGMCFGSPIISWAASKTKAYFEFLIICGLLMGGAFTWLLLGTLPISLMGVLFIGIGILSAYQILAIYLASSYVKEHLVGLTTACANMIIMIFGYVFHSSIGKMIQSAWTGEWANNGVPFISPDAYTYGLSVIPIGLFIGAIGFTLIRLFKNSK